MIAWLRLWRLRGRWVRLHVDGSAPSLEGFFRGRRGGHYLLDAPQLVTGQGEPQTISGFVAVPWQRVLFMEVKS